MTWLIEFWHLKLWKNVISCLTTLILIIRCYELWINLVPRLTNSFLPFTCLKLPFWSYYTSNDLVYIGFNMVLIVYKGRLNRQNMCYNIFKNQSNLQNLYGENWFENDFTQFKGLIKMTHIRTHTHTRARAHTDNLIYFFIKQSRS